VLLAAFLEDLDRRVRITLGERGLLSLDESGSPYLGESRSLYLGERGSLYLSERVALSIWAREALSLWTREALSIWAREALSLWTREALSRRALIIACCTRPHLPPVTAGVSPGVWGPCPLGEPALLSLARQHGTLHTCTSAGTCRCRTVTRTSPSHNSDSRVQSVPRD
jgi:hypothetical protein